MSYLTTLARTLAWTSSTEAGNFGIEDWDNILLGCLQTASPNQNSLPTTNRKIKGGGGGMDCSYAHYIPGMVMGMLHNYSTARCFHCKFLKINFLNIYNSVIIMTKYFGWLKVHHSLMCEIVSEFVVYVLNTFTTILMPVRYNPWNLNIYSPFSRCFLFFVFVWDPIFFSFVLQVLLALEISVGLLSVSHTID
jgi:hypothetical protein